MNSVNWAIFKEVNKVVEIEDMDFYEVAQFFVQRMYEESLERLVSFFNLIRIIVNQVLFHFLYILLRDMNSS